MDVLIADGERPFCSPGHVSVSPGTDGGDKSAAGLAEWLTIGFTNRVIAAASFYAFKETALSQSSGVKTSTYLELWNEHFRTELLDARRCHHLEMALADEHLLTPYRFRSIAPPITGNQFKLALPDAEHGNISGCASEDDEL